MAQILRKKTYFGRYAVGLGIVLIFFSTCKNSVFFKKGIDEGIIKFRISYPDLKEDNLMEGFLPKEMELTFKNNVYRTEISAGNGIFHSQFIADCNEKKILQSLKYWNDRTYTSFSKEEVKETIDKQPNLTIIYTNDIDTIAGYKCKKALAIYHKMMMPEITLFYTDEIAIENFNWYNQFKEIKGVLLAYEIDQFNLRTRFRAVEVAHTKIEESLFEIDEGYTKVGKTEMIKKLEKIFKDFMD